MSALFPVEWYGKYVTLPQIFASMGAFVALILTPYIHDIIRGDNEKSYDDEVWKRHSKQMVVDIIKRSHIDLSDLNKLKFKKLSKRKEFHPQSEKSAWLDTKQIDKVKNNWTKIKSIDVSHVKGKNNIARASYAATMLLITSFETIIQVFTTFYDDTKCANDENANQIRAYLSDPTSEKVPDKIFPELTLPRDISSVLYPILEQVMSKCLPSPAMSKLRQTLRWTDIAFDAGKKQKTGPQTQSNDNPTQVTSGGNKKTKQQGKKTNNQGKKPTTQFLNVGRILEKNSIFLDSAQQSAFPDYVVIRILNRKQNVSKLKFESLSSRIDIMGNEYSINFATVCAADVTSDRRQKPEAIVQRIVYRFLPDSSEPQQFEYDDTSSILSLRNEAVPLETAMNDICDNAMILVIQRKT